MHLIKGSHAMAQRGKRLMSSFDEAEIAKINQSRRNEEEIPTMAAAIHMLTKLGLAATRSKRKKADAAE
jgi:hypothetical protein